MNLIMNFTLHGMTFNLHFIFSCYHLFNLEISLLISSGKSFTFDLTQSVQNLFVQNKLQVVSIQILRLHIVHIPPNIRGKVFRIEKGSLIEKTSSSIQRFTLASLHLPYRSYEKLVPQIEHKNSFFSFLLEISFAISIFSIYIQHCAKSVRIRIYSSQYFPTFGLNTDRYGEIWTISPYSVRMRENTEQNNSEQGYFSRSVEIDYARLKQNI